MFNCNQALKHLLRCGETEDEEEVIHLSVQAVAAAQDVQLTRQLSDYLLGENDDLPKVRIANIYANFKTFLQDCYDFIM